MSLPDRNKLLIAGGVALIAIVVLVVVLLRGRGSKEEAGNQVGGFAAGAATAPAAAGAPGAPGVPGAPGAAPAAGEGEGEERPAGGPPLVGLVRMASGSDVVTRSDPFLTFEPPPQPTPPEIIANLPPVNLQAGGLRPAGLDAAQIGQRRVAGLLFNDRAYAILEKDGDYFVVGPGDVVDGVRVMAIAPESILVEDEDGIRWRVSLRLKGPGMSGGTTSSGTVSGVPQIP